ncbi:hypothetical protein GN956_G24971 [Arapaima gigas]
MLFIINVTVWEKRPHLSSTKGFFLHPVSRHIAAVERRLNKYDSPARSRVQTAPKRNITPTQLLSLIGMKVGAHGTESAAVGHALARRSLQKAPKMPSTFGVR